MGSSGNHGHVDGDAIAGLDAERLQRVGEAAYALVQIGIGEANRRAVFGFPEQRGPRGVLGEVPVDAIVGDVELAADEPLGVGQIPFERALGRLEPVEELGLLGPEGLGVALRRGRKSRDIRRAT